METNENKSEQSGLTDEHIKELLSRAYVQAIAASCGLNLSGKSEFDYGIDGTLTSIKIRKTKKNNRKVETGFKLDFQLKSSVDIEEVDKHTLKYDLEVKNYNDLIDEEVGTPRILILYKLPRDKKKWVEVTENCMELRGPAWWCILKGEPESENKYTKTIYIPKLQLLTSDSLNELMKKVERGEL